MAKPVARAGAAAQITVEIAGHQRFAGLMTQWDSLVRRALIPNVSMHPEAACAAAASGAAIRVVLAWRHGPRDDERRLVGVWALALERLFRRWPSGILAAPVDRNLILGAPVIDRDAPEGTLSAMFGALRKERSLPALIKIAEFPGEGRLYAAFRKVLGQQGATPLVQARLQRPKLRPASDPVAYLSGALSSKRRRELRRSWRRLAEGGLASVTTHRSPQEVEEAFEDFLALEASGWKGREGTALSKRAGRTPAFARWLVKGLAHRGLVTIMALRLDGRPVAMEVLLWCGGVAHTWKSAYDEDHKASAPGLLLFEQVTRSLLDDPGLVAADMSNNKELPDLLGPAAFWTERHEVINLMVALRPSGWAGLHLARLAAWVRG